MRKYCEECGKEVETKIVIKKEAYDVCGEAVEVDAQVLVCAECGILDWKKILSSVLCESTMRGKRLQSL